jgi:hypothetical protein
MGIAHSLLPDLELTIVVWHGDVTAADSVDHLLRLAEEPDWPPGLLHLTDMRTVEQVTLPDPELLELVFEGSHWRDEDLVKVVIVSPELLQRTTVQDAATAFGMTATVVADVASACAQLGINPARVESVLDELRSRLGQTSPVQ